MTCSHVLGLIDAGPFADYPRAHLEAAWTHARQCARCGPAMEAATRLTADLTVLPQPLPRSDSMSAILARIAEIEQARIDSAPAATTGIRSPTRDWSAWATAFGSVAAALAIVLATTAGDRTPIDVLSPRVGVTTVGLLALPSTTGWAAALAASLMLYLAGLFAPFRTKT